MTLEDLEPQLRSLLAGVNPAVAEAVISTLQDYQISINQNSFYSNNVLNIGVLILTDHERQKVNDLVNSASANSTSSVTGLLNKPANLWWLCHDLVELYRWLLEGAVKKWLDIGLYQTYHHAIQLELDTTILDPLEKLCDLAEKLDEQGWSFAQREQVANEVKIVFNAIAGLVQKTQNSFISGTGERPPRLKVR